MKSRKTKISDGFMKIAKTGEKFFIISAFISALFVSGLCTFTAAADNGDDPFSGHYYKIEAKHSSKVMDAGGNPDLDGQNVYQWHWADVRNQRFLIVPAADNCYSIIAVSSGKAIDLQDINNRARLEDREFKSWDGLNVWAWSYHGGDTQQWKFEELADGSYVIRSKMDTRYCIQVSDREFKKANEIDHVGNGPLKWKDIPEIKEQLFYDVYREDYVDSHEAGANICMWSYDGGDNQEWYLVELDEVPLPDFDDIYTGSTSEDIPAITGFNSPMIKETPKRVINQALIPFTDTTEADKARKMSWKAQNSPYYLLKEYNYWTRCDDVKVLAKTSRAISTEIEVGVETSQESAFTHTVTESHKFETSLEGGYGSGDKAGGSVTAKVGYSYENTDVTTDESSIGKTVSRTTKKTDSLTVGPYEVDKRYVTYQKYAEFQLYRTNGGDLEKAATWVVPLEDTIIMSYP